MRVSLNTNSVPSYVLTYPSQYGTIIILCMFVVNTYSQYTLSTKDCNVSGYARYISPSAPAPSPE